MSSEEINAVALSFTAKTSEATDVDQFLADYEKNKVSVKEALSKRPKPKARIIDRSSLGL